MAGTFSQGPLDSCTPIQPLLVIASLPTCKMLQHHSRTREELDGPSWRAKQTGQGHQQKQAVSQQCRRRTSQNSEDVATKHCEKVYAFSLNQTSYQITFTENKLFKEKQGALVGVGWVMQPPDRTMNVLLCVAPQQHKSGTACTLSYQEPAAPRASKELLICCLLGKCLESQRKTPKVIEDCSKTHFSADFIVS